MARSEREKSLEAYLRRRVLEHGGLCYKWTAPGQTGVPDRICVFPGGRIVFAETKTADGRLTAIQRVVHNKLFSRGCVTCVIRSREDVDAMLLRIRRVKANAVSAP